MTERPGVPIGRVAGIPVYLATSWFVVAFIVVLLFAPQVENAIGLGPPDSYLVAALYALLLLFSVLVHEFAHALVARALGMPVHQVVADLWGGHTQFTDEAPSPGRSALVAVVGPLANAALALIGLFILLPATTTGVLRLLVVALVFSNGFVAVFNLAPGLPLDGGRVVESAVWAIAGRRSAGTLAAGWCGRFVAAAVVVLGLGPALLNGRRPSLFSAIWVVMIALLLWRGATGAIAMAHLQRGAERLRLAHFAQDAVALAATSDAWREVVGRHHVVALDQDGRPIGVLRSPDAAQLLQSASAPPPGTALFAVMTALNPAVTIPADASGEQILHTLAGTAAHTLVITDHGGRVVAIADVSQLVSAVTGRA